MFAPSQFEHCGGADFHYAFSVAVLVIVALPPATCDRRLREPRRDSVDR